MSLDVEGLDQPNDVDSESLIPLQQIGFKLFLKHVVVNLIWTFVLLVVASILIIAFFTGVIESLIVATSLLGFVLVILGGAYVFLKILSQIRVWSSIITYAWISVKTRKPYIRITPTCPFLRGRPLKFHCFPVFSFNESALDVCHNPAAWPACQQSQVPEMVQILEKTDSQLIFKQINACRGLGMLGSTEGQPVLKDILLDETRHINLRTSAAWALGTMKTEESVDGLVSTLKSQDNRLKNFASDSLSSIGSMAVPRLIEFYRNESDLASEENIEIRARVLGILGKIGDPNALDLLLEATESSEGLIKLYATYALGDTKKEQAVTRLMELLGDPDHEVRDAARDALAQLQEISLKALIGVLMDPSKEDGEKYDIAECVSRINPTATFLYLNEVYNEKGAQNAMQLIDVMERYDVEKIGLVKNVFLKRVVKQAELVETAEIEQPVSDMEEES
ncbi:MAG: HEAT repeat domain-containing protein [Candidatus Hodarchaeota archaeon]